MAEPRAGADDARADRADGGVGAARLRPRECRPHGDALGVPAEAGADRRDRLDQPPLLQLPDAVRQRGGQGATLELNVDDATPGERGAHRRELAVQRAADDRHPVERLREQVVLLGMPCRELSGRVGELHHVRAGFRGEPEPAGEVRVQDVEAAGAQPEVSRLRVHDHVVTERDRPGQQRVGDAGSAVDLDPGQPFVPLEHRGDDSAAEAKRHAPPRAGRA